MRGETEEAHLVSGAKSFRGRQKCGRRRIRSCFIDMKGCSGLAGGNRKDHPCCVSKNGNDERESS